MQLDTNINIGTSITRITGQLNEIHSVSGLVIGHSCELEAKTPTGVIHFNFDILVELDDLIGILTDIRKDWALKDYNLWQIRK